MGIFSSHHDGRSSPVGNTSTVKKPEASGNAWRLQDGFCGDFFAELCSGIARTVVVVLHGNGGEHFAHLLFINAVFLAIGGRHHGEHRGCGKGARGAVSWRVHGIEALEA